jgi:hypothetical protein
MEGFSFVKPVTGLNRPNTGKEEEEEEDNDDDDVSYTKSGACQYHSTVALQSHIIWG